jgi:hypothetical protein
MAIKRTELPFEGHFVQLPNAWMRDKRLSRRARGLLAELMTHKVGWNINQSSLQEAGPEGREALSSAVRELREFGYLTIQQTRSDTSQTFGEVEYHITDPGLEPHYGFPVERLSRTTAKPYDGKPAPKKTISKEHHLENTIESDFEAFWKLYPRKIGKGQARTAFKAALKTVDVATLAAGVHRYAAEVAKSEQQFIAHPTTWLNGERWTDEPVETKIASPVTPIKAGRSVAEIRAHREAMTNGA